MSSEVIVMSVFWFGLAILHKLRVMMDYEFTTVLYIQTREPFHRSVLTVTTFSKYCFGKLYFEHHTFQMFNVVLWLC
jgi:hypothetical protein